MPTPLTDASDRTWKFVSLRTLITMYRRRVRRILILVLAGSAATVYWLDDPRVALALAAFHVLLAALWAFNEYRAARRGAWDEPAGYLAVDESGIELRRPFADEPQRVPYDDLVAAYAPYKLRHDSVALVYHADGWLNRRRRRDLPERLVADATSDELLEAIHGQLEARDRTDALEQSRAWSSLGEDWIDGPIAATATLTTIVGLAYLLQALLFRPYALDFRHLAHLVEWGAGSAPLEQSGQWFRLVTSQLLHDDPAHAATNVIGLALLGLAVEKTLGSRRTLAVALVAGLAGGAATAWIEPSPLNYGASGAVYGFPGALLVAWFYYRRRLPPPWTMSVVPLMLLVVQATVGLVAPWPSAVAHQSHAAGLWAGVATAWLVTPAAPDLDDRYRNPDALAWLTAAIAALYVAGLGWGVWYGATGPHWEDRATFLRGVARDLSAPRRTQLYNNHAWSVADADNPSTTALRHARDFSETAVDLAPRQSAYLDTLATLEFRLARRQLDASPATFRRALRLQRRALRSALHESDATGASAGYYASQLTRFVAVCGSPCRPAPTDLADAPALDLLAVSRSDTGPPRVAWRCHPSSIALSSSFQTWHAPNAARSFRFLALLPAESCTSGPARWHRWDWADDLPPID